LSVERKSPAVFVPAMTMLPLNAKLLTWPPVGPAVCVHCAAGAGCVALFPHPETQIAHRNTVRMAGASRSRRFIVTFERPGERIEYRIGPAGRQPFTASR
jgi:hypothetical protein